MGMLQFHFFDVPCIVLVRLTAVERHLAVLNVKLCGRMRLLLFTCLIPDIPDLTRFTASALANSAFSRQNQYVLASSLREIDS
jgi:hypothetical protein